jgi:hypothetical protein
VNVMLESALKNKVRHFSLIVAFGVVFLLTGCGPTLDISGTWTGIVVLDQGDEAAGMSYPLTLMLVQQGGNLTGNVGLGSFPFSFMIPIQDGSISGSIIAVSATGVVSILGSSETISIELEGQCSDTLMSGTGEYRVNGELHTFTWQAS